MSKGPLAYHGTFVHSTTARRTEILTDCLVAVSAKGVIGLVRPGVAPEEIDKTLDECLPVDEPKPTVRRLKRGELIVPGFVDTHNHAPQWGQRGYGHDKKILDWLDEVTFPHEARFADEEYARRTYASCVDGFVKQGITTASYYGSAHGKATKILAELCLEKGQRALVGKCNKIRNCPDYYTDGTTEESLKITKDFVDHVRSLDPHGALVRPIITPRFAICCDEELLGALGKMVKEDDSLMAQTHFNESWQEVEKTKELYPQFTNEADLYESFGLFNKRTIMAHCIWPTDYEIERLKANDVGVAHCPIATCAGAEWGAAPIKRYLDLDIKVGLGTDSGGGYSSSLLDAVRQAYLLSKGRATMSRPQEKSITLEDGFYMATLGGARVCGIADKVGSFEVGKEFDALEVSMLADGAAGIVEDVDTEEVIFEKFLMTADDRNIVKVYVQGRCIKGQ